MIVLQVNQLYKSFVTDEILSGNVKAGDTVSVGVRGKHCTFQVV